MYMVSFPEITRQFKICIASVGIDFSVRAELSFHIRHTLVSQTVHVYPREKALLCLSRVVSGSLLQ